MTESDATLPDYEQAIDDLIANLEDVGRLNARFQETTRALIAAKDDLAATSDVLKSLAADTSETLEQTRALQPERLERLLVDLASRIDERVSTLETGITETNRQLASVRDTSREVFVAIQSANAALTTRLDARAETLRLQIAAVGSQLDTRANETRQHLVSSLDAADAHRWKPTFDALQTTASQTASLNQLLVATTAQHHQDLDTLLSTLRTDLAATEQRMTKRRGRTVWKAAAVEIVLLVIVLLAVLVVSGEIVQLKEIVSVP